MGTDVVEVVESFPYSHSFSFKVHRSMCTELMKLVDRVGDIFPEIEAARPGCPSGIQKLCSLNSAIERAKLLLQHCSESSKLLLALRGDKILSSCQKSRDLLERSLVEIQTMVPVILAAEISRIIDDLRAATFALDFLEEEAGQAIHDLIHKGTSISDPLEVLQFAASRLHITSQKAILIERRSIRRLLEKVSRDDNKKGTVWRYLLSLLKKYENSMKGEQNENPNSHHDELPAVMDSGNGSICCQTIEVESYIGREQSDAQTMEAFRPLDFSSTSTASLSSSMNDLQLPIDVSNISVGSLATGYSSDCSYVHDADGSKLTLKQKNGNSCTCQSDANINEADLVHLSSLSDHQWEFQCKLVKKINILLQHDDQVCHFMSSGDYVEAIIRFLKDARNSQDIRAQRDGFQLLHRFMQKESSGIPISYVKEDAFNLLASFLDSEVIEEALALLEVLSGHSCCRSQIAASGALVSVLKFLDSQNIEFQKRAIQILYNLSSNSDVSSQIVSLECIPKLVPFINDSNVERPCIALLKNLCNTEEAKVSVAETIGCIASIAELLGGGSSYEVQEHAVAVLLSLCSQRVQYCQLVMNEGVIPSLWNISINGSDRGKASALELLRQLKDVNYDSEQESLGSDLDTGRDANHHSEEKKSSSKPSAFFMKKFFSKPKFQASKNKG